MQRPWMNGKIFNQHVWTCQLESSSRWRYRIVEKLVNALFLVKMEICSLWVEENAILKTELLHGNIDSKGHILGLWSTVRQLCLQVYSQALNKSDLWRDIIDRRRSSRHEYVSCRFGQRTFLPVYWSSKYLELNIVSPDAISSLSLATRLDCLVRRHSIPTSAVRSASSEGDSLGLEQKGKTFGARGNKEKSTERRRRKKHK